MRCLVMGRLVMGRLVIGTFSDGTFNDGMFSDETFSDGTFSDGTICMTVSIRLFFGQNIIRPPFLSFSYFLNLLTYNKKANNP